MIANALRGWRELFNIHPGTETQFRVQQGFSQIPIVGSAYANHMRNKSLTELNNRYRSNAGISWNQVKLPWVASSTSGNPFAGVSNLTPQISDNIQELYGNSPDEDELIHRRLAEKNYRANFRR